MSFFIELFVRGAILSGVVLLLSYLPRLRRLSAHGAMLTRCHSWSQADRGSRSVYSLLGREKRRGRSLQWTISATLRVHSLRGRALARHR